MIMAEKLILQQIWKKPYLRYLVVIMGSAFGDFLISLYYYAIAHGWIVTQAIVGFFLPFVSFIFSIWFIETKETSERLKLTFFSAIGMIIGSTTLLLMVK